MQKIILIGIPIRINLFIDMKKKHLKVLFAICLLVTALVFTKIIFFQKIEKPQNGEIFFFEGLRFRIISLSKESNKENEVEIIPLNYYPKNIKNYPQKEITVPGSVSYKGIIFNVIQIGEEAFAGSDLESIILPSTIRTIGYCAFAGCINLCHIDLPKSLKEIDRNSFFKCTSLAQIFIPSSVEIIGDYSFSGCSNLENINVDKENLNYKSINGVLFDREVSQIIKYPEGKKENYKIPNTVKTINTNCFFGLHETTIILPESISFIKSSAFDEYYNVKLVCLASKPPEIGMSSFVHEDGIEIFVRSESYDLYINSVGWKKLNILTINNNKSLLEAKWNQK